MLKFKNNKCINKRSTNWRQDISRMIRMCIDTQLVVSRGNIENSAELRWERFTHEHTETQASTQGTWHDPCSLFKLLKNSLLLPVFESNQNNELTD